jgi:hypothetical protein
MLQTLKSNKMQYIKHITALLCSNGTEYKKVRTQKVDGSKTTSTNQFYVNGKLVQGHERERVESMLLDNSHSTTFQELNYTK